MKAALQPEDGACVDEAWFASSAVNGIMYPEITSIYSP